MRQAIGARLRVGGVAAVLLGPATVLLAVFVFVPLVGVAVLSFFNRNPFTGALEWAGTNSIVKTLSDATVWQSLGVTGLYVLVIVPATTVIALLLASAVTSLGKGGAVWRVVYFLPVVVPLASSAVGWRWMFYPETGLVDRVFGPLLGVDGWLQHSGSAIWAIILVGVWRALGTAMVLFLAAYAGVPGLLHDVARVDGASKFQRFRSVTLPAIAPALAFQLVVTTRDALQVFDQVYVMTQGGPSGSTRTFAYLVWQHSIQFADTGGGAVLTMIMIVIVVAVALGQARVLSASLDSEVAR